MKFAYEPYVLKRFAEGRIFFVNANMPFEFFLDCFRFEQPFFLFSQLEDGRVAIVPNAMCIPLNLLQFGFWPEDLFPSKYEYVTMKKGTYPVLLTAHPVTNVSEFFNLFERSVSSFAKTTLWEFISTSYEFVPLKEFKGFKDFKETREKVMTREELPA